MNKSTLRPGLLVSLKTSIHGNVNYRVNEITRDYTDESGARRAKWETERTILDPREHEEAIKVRSRCRSLVVGVCSNSSFGLLCPEVWEGRLNDAVEEAQTLAREFNDAAALTRIGVYVLVGRIAADDAEAVRAINDEVRELLADMERGIVRLDPAAIRAAAVKVRGLGTMLSDDAARRVSGAIAAARDAAKLIVKAGESAAVEIDRAAIEQITRARVAFLDLDEVAEIAVPATVGRGVDLGPMTPEEVDELLSSVAVAGRELDI
jgi:hypothetical protein